MFFYFVIIVAISSPLLSFSSWVSDSSSVVSEFGGGRIRAQDEPQLVSYEVLEGVLFPFSSATNSQHKNAWKLVKDRADRKNAQNLVQHALFEYG